MSHVAGPLPSQPSSTTTPLSPAPPQRPPAWRHAARLLGLLCLWLLSGPGIAPAQTSVPAAPTGLTATAFNASVFLTWTAPSGTITDYKYCSKTGSGTCTTWHRTGRDVPGVLVNGLTNSTAYTFDVRAVNSAGDGSVATVSKTPATPTTLRQLYWINAGEIWHAHLDGSSPAVVCTGLTSPSSLALSSLALDAAAGQLYWTESYGKIRRANLDCSGATDLRTDLNEQPLGLALDVAAGKMYWTDWTDKIRRANLDGTGVEDLVVKGLTSTTGLALDVAAGLMYWASDTGKIQRATLDGRDVQDLVTGLSGPLTPTLDGAAGWLYWTAKKGDRIQRARLAGPGVEDHVPGLRGPYGLALDVAASKLYWTETETETETRTAKIQRADLDGTDVEALKISGLSNPKGLTLLLKPGKPGSLSATPGTGKVTLVWTPPVAGGTVAGWEYAQDNGTWTVIAGSSAGTTQHVVTGLTNGTAYTFKVRAVNLVDFGPASAVASATPVVRSAVPGAPTGLTATPRPDLGQVTLTWTAPTGQPITGYAVRKKAGTGSYENWKPASPTPLGTTHTERGLSPGTYTFQVRAKNGAGNGPASNSATVTLLAVPGAPTGLTATAGYGQATLSWTAPTSGGAVSGYEYRSKAGTAAYGWWTVIPGSGATPPSYTVPGLTNGTKYTFEVRAVNAAGGSPPSNSAMVTPKLGLTGKQTGPGQVTLRWTDPGDATITKYQLCQKPGTADCTAADTWTDIAGSGAKTTTHTVRRLSTGDHTFAVRAVSAAGTGPASESVPVTVVPLPGTPTGLRAAPGVGRVALSWTAPTGTVTGYKYCQKTGTATCASDWTPTGSATPAYLVKGLSNGTKYTFQVRAVNAAGDGPASNTASATPTTLQLYWSDSGTRKIQRANLDGSAVKDVRSGLTTPMGLAVDAAAGWLYWADRGTNKLQRANLDGTGVQDLVSTGSSWPTSLALDVGADKLYWTEQFTHKIRQAALAGSNDTDLGITGLERPYGLAPDLVAGHLYWTDWGRDKVQRANRDGSTIRDVVTRGLRRPYGLALNGGAGLLYWVDWEAHKIQRAKRDGSNKRDLLTEADGVNSPKGIALDVAGNKLYWTDAYAIKRANLDGSGAEDVVTGLSNPQGLALLLPPGTPTKLSATPDNKKVTLGWTLPADGGTAGWEYSSDNGTTWQVPTGVTGTAGTRTAVVTGLTNGTTYTFKVRAVNLAGDGPASGPKTATPRKPPGPPTGLKAKAGDTKVTLNWTAPTTGTVTGYQYRYKEGDKKSKETYTTWTDTNSTTTTHEVPGLTNGTTYTFEVRAKNGEVPGLPSNEDTATLPPPPPTGLTGEQTGRGEVTLSWTAPPGIVTSYKHRYKAGSGAYNDWPPIPDSNDKTTSYTVRGLENGTTYTFQVRAVNAGGDGEASNEATVTLKPGAPTGLTGEQTGRGEVTLTWTAPAPAGTVTGYKYCRKTVPATCDADTEADWTPTGSKTTTHLVTGLSRGTYTFQVRAVNTAGDGPASNAANVTVVGPPDKPTGLTGEQTGLGEVTLTWDDPGNPSITKYQYCQKSGTADCTSADSWTDITGSGATTTTHRVTGLSTGAHTFAVRAVNVAGSGDASESVHVTVVPPPDKPTDLTPTPGDGRGEVTLTWDDPSNTSITKYQDCEKTGTVPCTAADTWTDISGSGPTTTTHTVTVSTNRTVTVQVRAVNVADSGPPSDPVTLGPPPGAPTELTPTPGDAQVTLNWTAPSGPVTGYQYRSKAGSGNYGTWTSTGSTTTTHTVRELTNGKTYTFQVRAVNRAVPGPESNEAPVTLPPGQPTGLKAKAGDRQVTLTWANPDPADATITKYQYCQKTGRAACTAADTWTDMESSGAATRSYVVPGLTNGETYTFRIRAVNTGGNSLPSDSKTITLPPGKPTNLRATAGDRQVTLTWTAPPGIVTGYQYRYKAGDGNYNTWTPPSNTTTPPPVTGLTNGTKYTFEVRAVSGTVAGKAAEADATPLPPPTKPTGLTAKRGDKQVTLSWTDPDKDSITHYEYCQKTGTTECASAGVWMNMEGSGATTTSYVVPELTNNTTYTFQVRAVNTAGDGTASDLVSVPPLPPPGAAPTGLSAAPGNQRVALAWTAPAGVVTHYAYCQKTGTATCDPDTAGDWTSTGGPTPTYLVTGLTNDTAYTFQVRAVNSAGNSPASSTASATPVALRQLYWTTEGKIQHANLDDKGVKGGVHDLVPNLSRPNSLAFDVAAGKLYWTTVGRWNAEGKIQRANLDGSAVETLVTGLAQPNGLALNRAAGQMYWVDSTTDKIQRANLDGSGVEDLVTSGLTYAFGPALDVAAGKMYWTNWGSGANKIQRANLDGTGIEDLGTGRGLGGLVLDVAADRVYWVDGNKIKQANLDGTGVEDLMMAGGAYNLALDVAADKLYWTTEYSYYGVKMRRADLDGTGVQDLVTGGSWGVNGIALLLKPGAPAGLSVTPGDGQVTLSWTLPTADVHIARWEYLQRTGTTWATTWTPMAGSTAGTTSHTVTGLTNGRSYTFKVRAKNLVGDGPASSAVGATPVRASATPGAPTGLKATSGNGQVTLTWTPPTGPITEYQYQQKTSGNWGTTWTTVPRRAPTHVVDGHLAYPAIAPAQLAPTHMVEGLSNGTAYTFRVRAVNGTVNGTASGEETATPQTFPTGLTATTGSGQVTLAWTNPTNSSITKYQYLQRSSSGNYGTWTDIPGSGATTTSHVVTGLTNGTIYAFRLRAVNAEGSGPASAAVRATPLPPLQAAAGNGRVALAWTAPAGTVTGYEYRYKAGSGTYTTWKSTGGTAPTYLVSGLSNDTTSPYTFEVRAVTNAGNKAVGTVSATPTASLRQLYWTDDDREDGRIQRAKLDGSGVQALVTDLRSPSGIAPDGAAGKLYWVGDGKIQRATLDGSNPQDLVTSLLSPGDLALDVAAGKLYWTIRNSFPTDGEGSKIQRARLDGSGVQDLVNLGDWSAPWLTYERLSGGLALDRAAGKLYWTDSDVVPGSGSSIIRRANLDGTGVEDLVTGVGYGGLALDVAADKLYWTDGGTNNTGKIQRASLDGTGVVKNLVNGLNYPRSLALDIAGNKLYWVDFGSNSSTYGRIKRANLDDGTDVEDLGLYGTGIALLLKPGAPATLSATPGTGQVTLAWTPPVAGGTAARWEYLQDNGTWTVMAGSTASTTTHVVTGLTNGRAYTFKVRAGNLVGDGPASSAVSVKPGAESKAPSAPTGLKVATVGSGQMRLTWTVPTGQPITGYQWCGKAGTTATCTDTDWSPTDRLEPRQVVTKLKDKTKLSDGTAYTFKVRAVNDSGNGPPSSAVTSSILLSPTGLTATTGTGQVTLRWTDPGDASITQYQYRQKAGSGNYGNWTDITINGAKTTNHVVTGLSNTTAYTFRLRAVNAGGPGPASIGVRATPGAPTGLTATAGNGRVTLSWTDPTDASITKYLYGKRSGSGNYSWASIPGSGATTTSYTVRGLTNGTAYSFKLLARNAAGGGPASAEVSATPSSSVSTSLARAVSHTGGDTADEAAPPEPVGVLEHPAPHTVQSGLGLLSGWVCKAETVTLVLTTASGTVHRAIAAYGTSRTDTQEACGDRDNGFSLVWNWNLLGDGTHQVQVLADGEEVVSRAVTVVTPGRALVRGVSGPYRVTDFPRVGESVDLHWDDALQHFRLAPAEAGDVSVGLVVSGHPASLLENPAPHSVQSGLGLISGWVCEAESVAVRLTTASGVVHQLPVAYGMSRADTADKCGDTENGFGAVFNWNQLGAGTHTVALLVDGIEEGRQSFTVTTWGEEFVRGLQGPGRVEDFPEPGQAVIVEWQAGWQHFGIVGVEKELGITN